MLICDEVQTGFGRTGRWAAYEHAGITPDLSTWAKAMGGGLPISAVIGRAEVMDGAQPGTLGGTYGGNPVACASALATLRVMESLDLPARAAALGERMHARLVAMAERSRSVSDVRGLGAMLAFELSEDGDPQRPAPGLTSEIIKRCIADGVLVIAAAGHNIRLLPPLTIEDEQIDRGLDVVERHVLAVGGTHG
jgi:4-aminobutyrate aminotransferase/(S)-3-amino-2-methylpropionate transaminase